MPSEKINKYFIHETFIDESYYEINKKTEESFSVSNDIEIELTEQMYNYILYIEQEWEKIQDKLSVLYYSAETKDDKY